MGEVVWLDNKPAILPRDIQGVIFECCDFRMRSSLDSVPCLQGLARETRDLQIRCCGGIRFLWSSAPSLYSPFEKLEALRLAGLDDSEGLAEGGVLPPSPGTFKHLRWLIIDQCDQMTEKLFTPIIGRKHFYNLEGLWICRYEMSAC